MDKPQISLMLDSGAYTIFTKKVVCNLDAYAKFALDNQQHISAAVNMDVIGLSDTAESARLSYENFLYLKNLGLKVLPVFHSGEPVYYLDRMIEDADWIGLSASMVSNAESFKWYDAMWNYVTDKDGYPIAKFHAFGDTVPRSMLSFPWYSSDSTTWVIAGGMAGRIFINDKAIQFRCKAAKDFNYIGAKDSGIGRETWEAEFRKMGLDPDKCINTEMRESDIMLIRTYVNAYYFMQLQERSRSMTSYKSVAQLFGEKKYGPGKPATEPLNIHLAFTASTATRALAVIAHLGVKNLLISHYYVEKKVWAELIVPFLYDPVKTVLGHDRCRREYEFLAGFMLQPAKVA